MLIKRYCKWITELEENLIYSFLYRFKLSLHLLFTYIGILPSTANEHVFKVILILIVWKNENLCLSWSLIKKKYDWRIFNSLGILKYILQFMSSLPPARTLATMKNEKEKKILLIFEMYFKFKRILAQHI